MVSRRFLISVFLSFLLLGCAGNDAADFYPLNEGWSWEYKLFVLDSKYNNIGEGKYTITNLATTKVNNKSVIPQK